MNRSVLFLRLTLLSALLLACATQPANNPALLTIDTQKLPAANTALQIPGLGPCTDNPDRTLHLNHNEPVTVLVHGCFGSAGRFRALAQVYAYQGQQAVCFNYDDRDSLMVSSGQLNEALKHLTTALQNKNITVIGHSQGGLVARKALTENRPDALANLDSTIRLVTVSAPFAGIASANHCGYERARKWSLGLVPLICQIVTGSKWRDITYSSAFIRDPGQLVPQVVSHLKIVTDERDSCREFKTNGECASNDFVFNLNEQRSAPIDASDKVNIVEIKAGHVEIVGNENIAPIKLIELLQHYGFLKPTQAGQQAEFSKFLAELYAYSDVY